MAPPISAVADVHYYWNSQEIEEEVNRGVARGIKAAAIFLSARVKELLSVPAPRVRLEAKDGTIYYRAGWLANAKGIADAAAHYRSRGRKTPRTIMEGGKVFIPSYADPGAPPRKLSGRLRTSIAWETDAGIYGTLDYFEGASARVGTNVKYGRKHELGSHKFLIVALNANRDRLARIIGTESAGGFGVRTS